MIRMKVQVAELLLLIGFSSITTAQQQEVRSNTVPGCVVPAVASGGPIILGTITGVRLTTQDAYSLSDPDMGSVSVRVERYLRGPQFPTRTVTMPVDWTRGPRTFYGGLQQPIWYEAS